MNQTQRTHSIMVNCWEVADQSAMLFHNNHVMSGSSMLAQLETVVWKTA